MKLPIPQDWDGMSWCRWAICWPDSENWIAILRGFVTLPQRGWTWDERTGSIIAVQQIGREITSKNLPERQVIMACGDEGLQDIAAAIQALAMATQSLANNQCCSNLQIDVQGGLQGTITQGSGEVIPIYGSQPPEGIPEGEFPPEYPNLEAYLSDKCKKATTIVDGLINTLTNLSAIGTFNAITLATIVAASIAFGIIFPPAAIPTAISLLIILSGSLVLLSQLVSALNDNREELICILYEGDNTEIIINRLADLLDVILASIPASGVVLYALKALTLVIANSDTLNTLFSGEPAIGSGDADCSECSCGVEYDWLDNSDDLGFIVENTQNVGITNPSGNPSGAYQITADVTGNPGFYHWKSPALVEAQIIDIGARLQSRCTQVPPTTLYLEIYVQSNPGVPIVVGGLGNASGEVVYDLPLDDWAGETIVNIGFYAAWADNGSYAINYDYIRYVCP